MAGWFRRKVGMNFVANGLIFKIYIRPGGEVANAAVCKTAIHGCKSHLGLNTLLQARVVEWFTRRT
jgi:hypothetical protein